MHVRVRFVWGRGRGLVGGPGGRSRPIVQLSRDGRAPDAVQTCECVEMYKIMFANLKVFYFFLLLSFCFYFGRQYD